MYFPTKIQKKGVLQSDKIMEKVLKVAVIGCGRVSVMHFSAVENLSKYAKLVACCDIKPDRADSIAEKYNAKAYYDYKKMIDEEELDAIHICLPHYLHVPVAQYAIKRGVAVLSEKPMAIDEESAEETVCLAEKLGVLYGVIMQCRYNNSAKAVKNALVSGKLGKIYSARSVLTWLRQDSYYSESDWKGTWEKEGGGVIIDQAIHTIDLVNWLVDSEIESVSCSMANRAHENVEVEDSAEGLVVYKNGVKYSFYAMNNYACDEPIEIRLYCEKGKVVFSYDDAYITYNDGTSEEAHQSDVQAVEGGKDYWGFQHEKQISQFYKACLGLEPLEISGREALKTHKLVCKMYNEGKKKMGL